jgi:CRP-like cAMP-binding protein
MEKLSELAAKIGLTFQEGETVFNQGDEGDTMFIVQEGSVVVIRERDGAGTVVASLKQGEFFGEMALVDQEPRSATVKTLEKTTLVPITRDFFFKHSSRNIRFVQTVMETLGLRLEKVDKMLRWRFSSPENVPEYDASESADEPVSAVFLKSFSPETRSIIGARFEEGDQIFRQGQPGDTMYIILEGQVEISQEADDIMVVQARYGRGNFFGEMAALSGHNRSATARAVTSTVLLPITGEVFLGKVKSHPEIAFHTVQILILRLRRALEMLG